MMKNGNFQTNLTFGCLDEFDFRLLKSLLLPFPGIPNVIAVQLGLSPRPLEFDQLP